MLPLKHIHHRRLKKPQKHTSLDNFMYVVAFAGPIMTLPQVYDIWVSRNLAVNPITWISYLLIGFVWLYYGIVHREKIIIFSNVLGAITTGLVVVGAFLRG